MLRGGVGAVVMRRIMMLRVITTIRNTIMTLLEVIGVIMIPHKSLTMQTLPIRRWKSCSGSCVS